MANHENTKPGNKFPQIWFIIIWFAMSCQASAILTKKRQLLFFFDKIDVKGSVSVFVEPRARNEEAFIYADAEIIDEVSLYVRDRTLFIEANNTFDISRRLPFLKINAARTFPVEIIIGSEKLSELTLSGNANLSVNNITSKRLSVSSLGTGSFYLESSSIGSLQVNQFGSGPVILKGKNIFELDLKIKGPGRVLAQELFAERIKVQHDGNSNIQLHPLLFLDARLTTGGNILLHNRPKNLVVNQNANGKVVDILPEAEKFYDLNASLPTLSNVKKN